MKDKDNNKIELRSEEVQEIMGKIPSWILRWGITIIAVVLLGLFVGSYFFKYPDTLTAPIVITSSTPPVELNAHATGKLDSLFIKDKQEVKQGDCLGIIENNANSEDIRKLNIIFQDWKSKRLSMNHFYGVLKRSTFRLGEIQQVYSVFFDALHNYVFYHETNYYPKK